MHDHIRDSLKRFDYSEQLQETAVSRILFEGEELSQVATDLGIHSTYTLTHWVRSFQRKIETGLITLPAMTTQQKQDLQALKQRNAELEQALQDANLMILALNMDLQQNTGQISKRHFDTACYNSRKGKDSPMPSAFVGDYTRSLCTRRLPV